MRTGKINTANNSTGNISAIDYLIAHGKDGWWPYKPGGAASLEPTVWAAIALRSSDKAKSQLALQNLLKWQKADGGWSTEPQLEQSDWTSQLALIALELLKPLTDSKLQKQIEAAQNKGLKLVMSMRADMLSDIARVLMTVFNGPDFDYPRGWPWEKNNSHWVEPTAYAVLALKLCGHAGEKRYNKAILNAHEYLLSKACHPAGWNYGSPNNFSGYEVASPYSTAWALLSMQDQSAHETVKSAREYLRQQTADNISIATNALSILTASAFGEDTTNDAGRLQQSLQAELSKPQNNQALTINAIALAALAEQVTPTANPLKFTPQSRG